MRTGRTAGVLLGATTALLAGGIPAGAWHGWAAGPVWEGPPWSVPAAVVTWGRWIPAVRLIHPPGLPLSVHDPAAGTTYCLSRDAGVYFLCGISAPAPRRAGPTHPAPPPALSVPSEEPLAPASGVLLLRLPPDAEVTVDGESVGLSAGLGVVAVAPGRRRLVIRLAGRETERALTVPPRGILTITPDAVAETDP